MAESKEPVGDGDPRIGSRAAKCFDKVHESSQCGSSCRPSRFASASGPIEITLHDENRAVVTEANSLAEVFGTPKNAVHQFFR